MLDIVAYYHSLPGGGFVLPLSNGSITMMTTLLRESNAASYGAPVYLALAEYSRPLSQLDRILR